MVDYEKLMTAHRLCQKLQGVFYADFIMSGYHCEYTISNSEAPLEDIVVFISEDIDEFIARLEELTQSKSSYKVGQEVWKLNDKHAPQAYIIEQVDENCIEKYTINDNEDWYQEDELWPTLDALTHNQLQFWFAIEDSLKKIEFEGEVKGFPCKHESDGILYHSGALYEIPIDEADIPFSPSEKLKCNKCGEFYR